MLGFYNYTVILTYIGMLISFFGISQAVQGNFFGALVCLMLSGFCDMFDGKIASTRKRTAQEKRFGIQIDSMADLICFGALPAVFLFSAVPGSVPATVVAGLYLLCALIRLSYFNVDEEERQDRTDESRSCYRGMPVTTVALLLPALWLALKAAACPLTLALPIAMAVFGLAFLSPFGLKKPGNLGKIIMTVLGVAEFVLLILSR